MEIGFVEGDELELQNLVYARSSPTGKMRILLIEDNITDAKMTKSLISKYLSQVEIEITRSMKEAYDQYKKSNFDLILLDLNLPDGFGPSSVKEVRMFFRNTPIVVVTSLASDLTIDQCKEKGAQALFLKSDIGNSEFVDGIRRFAEKIGKVA